MRGKFFPIAFAASLTVFALLTWYAKYRSNGSHRVAERPARLAQYPKQSPQLSVTNAGTQPPAKAPAKAPTKASDAQVLADQNAPASQRAEALYRLGAKNETGIRERALQFVNHSDPLLRAASAYVLGGFDDDEAFSIVIRLMEDPMPLVQSKAIEALGNHPGPRRAEVLKAFLKKPGHSESLRMQILNSLVRSQSSPGDREGPIAELMKIAHRPVTDPLRMTALTLLMTSSPRHPKFLEFLRKQIQGQSDLDTTVRIIQHLSLIRDPWMQEHIAEFMARSEPPIRIAALQAIPLACPKNRWDLLQKFIKDEKSPGFVIAAIQLPLRMPGSDAVDFLERLLKEKGLLKNELEPLVRQTIPQVKSIMSGDPCGKKPVVPEVDDQAKKSY